MVGGKISTDLIMMDCVQPKGPKHEIMGEMMCGPIPKEETDATRISIRRTMKQLSGPYMPFVSYYPLDDTIELYMEIWYESSSSDGE